MPRTCNHELKTHHKALGLSSNVSIMNDRANILVGAMGMATDKAYLERTTGKRLTDGDVYMSRFVGRYGAKAILKGNPNAPISRYIKVDNRNGSLYTVNGRIATVKEFRAKMQRLITKEADRYQDVVNQARFDAFVSNIATTGMVDLNLAKL